MLRVGTSNSHCEVQLALQEVKGAVIPPSTKSSWPKTMHSELLTLPGVGSIIFTL
jgi:hypothetical protein